MKYSKLLKTISALDIKQFNNLKQFVQTPCFVDIKQKQKVVQLFSILSPYYPDFDHEDLEKETVYCRIFPNDLYSNSKMDRLMNRLLVVIRKFIVMDYTLTQKQPGYEELILARFYQDRKLNNYFQNAVQSFKTKHNHIHERTPQFYLNDYLMEVEQSEFASFYNQRKADLNLPNTIQSLDVFYVYARLEHACTLMTQQVYHVPLNLETNLLRYEEMCRFIESNDYLKVPAIEVYYMAFKLLYLKDDDQFEVLLDALHKKEHYLSNEQLRAIQSICRSYCIRRYNKGDRHYLQMAFDLYKAHLESGHLYHDQGIFAGRLKNIVIIGLKMKQYTWVLNIIESHRCRIIGVKNPEDVYRFNLATYYFAKKEYAKAQEFISGYEEDTYYKISAKRLELKIYFELESPLLESKMSAFKVYLFRISNKLLSEIAKQGNKNFINLLLRIYNTQTYQNIDRIDKLIKRISTLRVVTERDWLLEQLEKMR